MKKDKIKNLLLRHFTKIWIGLSIAVVVVFIINKKYSRDAAGKGVNLDVPVATGNLPNSKIQAEKDYNYRHQYANRSVVPIDGLVTRSNADVQAKNSNNNAGTGTNTHNADNERNNSSSSNGQVAYQVEGSNHQNIKINDKVNALITSVKGRQKESSADDRVFELLNNMHEQLEKHTSQLALLEERYKLSAKINSGESDETNQTYNYEASGLSLTNEKKESIGVHIVIKKNSPSSDKPVKPSATGSLSAVIDETKTVSQGDIVPLRLLESTIINGQTIPANTIIYSRVAIGNARIQLQINTIVLNNQIIPVKAEIFDKDGFPGVYCPNAEDADAFKSGLSDGINNIDADKAIAISQTGNFKDELMKKGVNVLTDATKLIAARKLSKQKVEVVAGYRVHLQLKGIN
ncbi:MAG: conjugative transposon protein TraM [Solitalea-like symbiont of Acarus siro]